MKEINLNLDAFEILKPNKQEKNNIKKDELNNNRFKEKVSLNMINNGNKNKNKIIKTFILPQETVDKINDIAKIKSTTYSQVIVDLVNLVKFN
ncbi:hypothetical protein [Spiroplasma ixodetis]|uniref:hypothetical protein n=1 Tax=Spiroplasma ixodetis TaxID=2141 RepID=UPI001AEE3D3D|nr:hypothetical protein [Spiroplasma ixodetis]WJG71355.1 hypothetical protein SIXOD_v1c27770 [Spiroplasma ixodetis Y32]